MADTQWVSPFDRDRYRPRAWLVWPGESEGGLWEVGSELRFLTGSEGRLLRRSLPLPIVMGRRAVPPPELARAVSALSSEVLSGAPDSVIRAAASPVIQAMQQSGAPADIAFIPLTVDISAGWAGSPLSGPPASRSGATDSSNVNQASDSTARDFEDATLAAVSAPGRCRRDRRSTNWNHGCCHRSAESVSCCFISRALHSRGLRVIPHLDIERRIHATAAVDSVSRP
jgi:hypothetical protein